MNGGDNPPGARRLWSDHGEATRPGPSGWQLPLPVLPAFHCHFGYQSSPGTPITKLAFWSPHTDTYRVGTRKGARPRARLSQWRGRGWFQMGAALWVPPPKGFLFPAQTLLNPCPLFTLKKAFGPPPSEAGASGGGPEALGPRSWELVLWP